MSTEIQLFNAKKKQKELAKQRISEDSKQRLKEISRKKFTTCFIFALSEFEQVFGLDLWGHGLPEDRLTDVQKANRERWNQIRANILNKGNTQARAMESEMDLHDIKFIGYEMHLFGGKNNGQEK